MIIHHPNLIQGSDEWLAARCGLLTASEMKHIITSSLKIAENADSRTHLWELLAQRVTRYVEPQYVSSDMLRGQEDEIDARILYNEKYAPVQDVGFITNNEWGFTLGYSPDGLVGDDGAIECKSRRQKFQMQTITDGTMPKDYLIQVQTGMLIANLKWVDFISYCGGLPMITIRVFADDAIQEAIIKAASAFEKTLSEKLEIWKATLLSNSRLIPTQRKIVQEMFA